jgi:flotillin
MMQPGYTGYTGYQSPTPPPEAEGMGGEFGSAMAVLVVSFGIAITILVIIAILKQLRLIARPHEALVFSGLSHKGPDGTMLGYRVVLQGRGAIRIPFLYRVDRMDMRLLPIDIVVQNAYSHGNIPLHIHAIANVKIHSDPVIIRNAIERFLGRSVREIEAVAQQTLEGAVREVVATLTPEQVNEDRLLFAEKLINTADDDLTKLGLQLDTLKIQNVADSVSYLDSLGRPQIASALRDAENSENEAQLEITQAQAGATQRAEFAKADAEKMILSKRNEVRRVQAELDGDAQAVEREAEAAGKTARANAERELQTIRAALEERRLIADVVIPAETQRQAQAILAVAEAAPTAENGAAAVEVLRLMSDAWRSMGAESRELYVIQHLEELVGAVVSHLGDVHVKEVNVLDPGDGSGLASYAATYPQMVATVMRALAETTGVDVPAILAGTPKKAGA